MNVMNGLGITLEEKKRFLCVWLFYYVNIFFSDSRMEVPRYAEDIDQVLLHEIMFFVSVNSAAVKFQAKLLPFAVNCQLQLAGF